VETSLRAKVLTLLLGSPDESCAVPEQPVRFGRRHWLAQHRWLEPLVGLLGLGAVGGLYVAGFSVLAPLPATLLMASWAVLFLAGLVLRLRRPCTVLRLPIHALLLWILVVATASTTGLSSI
jgi:hypothetical protein